MANSRHPFFGTKLGFYLAAIGSAFGLGNLWRFPYVVAENGGGAFVLIYLFLTFVIGMPFLISELILGKLSRSSVASALLKLAGERYQANDIRNREKIPAWVHFVLRHLGKVSLAITILVLAYYSVICGWVLHFFVRLLVSTVSPEAFQPEATLRVLLDNGWLQVLLTSVHLLVVGVIVAKDLEEGLEKWLGYCMPIFGLLLLILAIESISLDSTLDALRFLFYPDFTKLNASSLAQAIGHVLFTLSVGFGTMVTFGSYLRDKVYLPIAGFRVAILDFVISLWAGVMIFPLVMFSGTQMHGPDLLFQAVPRLVKQLSGGHWFGVGFFLCLYLAALGASIGLLEPVVANLRELRRIPRMAGTIWAVGLCFVASIIPALSSNVLKNVRWGGKGVLEILDAGIVNWILPVVALLVAQAVAWLVKRELTEAEFITPESPTSLKLYRHWLFVLKYVATPIVVIALLLQVLQLF